MDGVHSHRFMFPLSRTNYVYSVWGVFFHLLAPYVPSACLPVSVCGWVLACVACLSVHPPPLDWGKRLLFAFRWKGEDKQENFPRPESLFVCPQPTKRFQLLQRNLESFETGDPRFRRLCNSPPLWDDGSARLTPLRTMSNAASGERLQPSHALRTGSFPKELTPV